jgi:phosphoserine phosphatase
MTRIILVCCAGIPELVSELRSQGKQVFLVSGGFRQIIHPLAASLDIPLSHVFANTILFDVSPSCWGY